MNETNAITTGASPASPPALDPRWLGRPVHLLEGFGARVREDLSELLRTGLNRRYRASFEVGRIRIERQIDGVEPPRWRMYQAPAGWVAFAVDRSLLLCVLDYRYGPGAGGPAAATAPETATEERVATLLGDQFVAALSRSISALPGAQAGGELPPCVRSDTPAGKFVEGWWTLRAEVHERRQGARGTLWFALDDSCMNRLFRGLAPTPDRRSATASAAPLAKRLQLTLVARLLEREVPLGTLLDARPGDVIPIVLGPTQVLVGDSVLFTATVAEHRGKLCLTAFEDME